MPGTAMQNAIAVVGINIGRTVRAIGSPMSKSSPKRQASRAVSCSLAVSCSRVALLRPLSPQRRCRRQSAAACASMNEGTGRAVSQPDGKPAAFKVVFLQLS